MAILSEKTEELLTGQKFPFQLKEFIKDVGRGIFIALKNFFIEIIILLCLLFLVYIPFIGLLTPILIFMVEAYFYGYSMIDYYNERHRLSVKESQRFIYKNKWVAIANGTIFYLLLLVPILGLLIAPSYGVIAASLAAHKIRTAEGND